MTGHQSSEYIHRINRVIDYIEANLDKDLTLKDLASVAAFSPFHFHRIFGAMVGETLYNFIQRIRIERAAMQLVANPKRPITDVAIACGFSSSAPFARAFKEYFGMSASEWRKGGHREFRNFRQMQSNSCKSTSKIEEETDTFSFYIDSITRNLIWRKKMTDEILKQVEVREMPDLHVAYVRHTGPYQGDSELFEGLFQKLAMWAGPRGLFDSPDTQFLCAYHDDPEITEANKLRVSVCVTVPKGTSVEGEIGQMTIAGGKYAAASFELTPDKYQQAWDMVFGSWLLQSGYQPTDGLCYELMKGDPAEHPEGKHLVDICIPVKPL